VVGDGYRIHAERLHLVEHAGDFLQAIEQRIMAVIMQMHKTSR
jgi:hypothetical protein